MSSSVNLQVHKQDQLSRLESFCELQGIPLRGDPVMLSTKRKYSNSLRPFQMRADNNPLLVVYCPPQGREGKDYGGGNIIYTVPMANVALAQIFMQVLLNCGFVVSPITLSFMYESPAKALNMHFSKLGDS